MGNITGASNDIKSNLFGCARCEGEKNLCSNPNTYGEIKVDELPLKNIDLSNQTPDLNYFNNPEMRIKPNEFVRSFSFENKYNNAEYDSLNIKLNNYTKLINTNYKEEDINKFNKEKFENNPKILELLQLLGETNNNFILTEKESFYIKNIYSKNYLVEKLFHYKDNSYYLGYVNKKHNKELFGTYYYNDGSIYKGFFENDKINGRGRLLLIDKYIYEGDFVDELFNGFGKIYSLNNLKYEGNWKNNLQEGYGIEHYPDGSYYSGMFKKGKKHGKGKFVFKNDETYEGDFDNDEMTGWGLYKRNDGRIYYGMVKNHFIEGIGIFIWKDNKKYIGEYKNELKDGFGIFYTNDGRNYSGFWKAGKQDGYGVITNNLGQKFYLKFSEGKKINCNELTKEEKTNIDKQILEGEKKINIGKLYVIANELIMEREKNKKEDNEQKSEFSLDKKKLSTLNYKNSLMSISFDKQFHKSISINDTKIKDIISNNKKCISNISSDNLILNNRLKEIKCKSDTNNKPSYIDINKKKKKKFININEINSSSNLINGGNINIKSLDKNKSDAKTGENSIDNQESPKILNIDESPKKLKI